jgi:rubrerythrin
MADEMDHEEVIEALNGALARQYRSALQFSLAAGGTFGVVGHAWAETFREFARAETDDLVRLAEKITALGGDLATDVPEVRWWGQPAQTMEGLIESETDAVEQLKAAISPTGQEGKSEAVEHRLEHLIMRKQEQIDALLRMRRNG